MFVILLNYTRPLEQLDAALPAHRIFLEQQYAQGQFLFSGPQIPRTGGVILARGRSRARIEALLEQDPFAKQGLAEYQVIEFQARGFAQELAAFAEPD